MFLVGMLGWWYADGWKARRQSSQRQLLAVARFFSMTQLARTLFAPFRQISAGQVNGPLGVQLRAFFDKLLSRVIGMIIRTLFIVFGLISLVLLSIVQGLIIVLWLLVPLAPVVGCIIAVIGWVPWS